MTRDVTFEIVEHLGALGEYNRKGFRQEVNVVAWNGREPKIDIRGWNEDHEFMTRGITLFDNEAIKLAKCLRERYKDWNGVEV